jgi:hypothetical protein
MIGILKIKKSHIGDAIIGIVTVLGINILFFSIFLALNTVSPIFLSLVFSLGLIQLLYVIPLLNWSIKRRVKGFTKGVIMGAITTAAINIGCFIVTILFFSNISK